MGLFQELIALRVFDVITSIKSMEGMEYMYEKCPITLLHFALPNVTFCGIHRNIM